MIIATKPATQSEVINDECTWVLIAGEGLPIEQEEIRDTEWLMCSSSAWKGRWSASGLSELSEKTSPNGIM